MRRSGSRLGFRARATLVSFLVLLLVSSAAPSLVAAQAASPAPSRPPNIVFVLADDLDPESWKLMPQIEELLVDEGVTFDRFFVADPLCCPSRTSILRGQYVHNHRVFSNGKPDGGYGKFLSEGLEESTVATWLQDAGYRTALMGKYLNQYPTEDDPTHVPMGWDEWAVPTSKGAYEQFDYELNENGTLVDYGDAPEDYLGDVMSAKGADFIARSAADEQPFFIELSVYPPHLPATPAPRYADAFPDAQAPRPPSFNEADMSDKPEYLRGKRLLGDEELAKIDEQYRQRLRSMLAVDDLVANVVETLEATGQLDNTYILFSSDNGYHLGEHRLAKGKQTAFETDIRVPLVVRGPGVPAGETRSQLASNVDLAPTFLDWAGMPPPSFVDGRSLAPLLGSSPPDTWREAVMVERLSEEYVDGEPDGDGAERADRSRREDAVSAEDERQDGARARREARPGAVGAWGGDGTGREPPSRAADEQDRAGPNRRGRVKEGLGARGGPGSSRQAQPSRKNGSGGETDGRRTEAVSSPDGGGGAVRFYRVMRTEGYVFVEYVDGGLELYDLTADPHQLENLADDTDPALLDRLSSRLSELSGCAGADCRVAEDAPAPELEAPSSEATSPATPAP